MKALARVGIVALAVLGFAVLPAPTEAAECTGDPLVFSGTLGSWNGDPVTCGDKIYTLLDTDLDDTAEVTITAGAGLDTYQLAIDFGALPLGDGTDLFIDYSIAVIAASPDFITSVDLDVTQNCSSAAIGGTCRVEKDVFVDEAETFVGTLVSVNGVPDSMLVNTRLLTINERLTVTCDENPECVINSVQNTITQERPRVPLPGTLVMLGMGLLGAGLWRYRKGA